jgi:hypothetical protein
VTAGRRCDGCGHAFHRDTCPRKGTTGCIPLLDSFGAPVGIACSRTRRSCPCPFGECHTCGAPIAGAAPLPLGHGAAEIDIDRGSAGAPDGTLAVRKLPDGTLACRRLADGEQPGEREWRGREHAHQLAPVKTAATEGIRSASH